MYGSIEPKSEKFAESIWFHEGLYKPIVDILLNDGWKLGETALGILVQGTHEHARFFIYFMFLVRSPGGGVLHAEKTANNEVIGLERFTIDLRDPEYVKETIRYINDWRRRQIAFSEGSP